MRRQESERPFSISLRDIPAEGLSKRFELSGAWAEAVLGDTEAKPASELVAEVSLHKERAEVFVHGTLKGSLTMECSRCAGPAAIAVDGEFDVTYVPQGALVEESPGEAELDPGQADFKPYVGEELDLDDTFREELLLALPIAPLCSEACKGLCTRCGHDLNQSPCACVPEPKDHRFAALRNVKL